MRIQSIHFHAPLFVCGAFSPKSLNMSASGDRAFVTAIECDMANRVFWLTADGNRLEPRLRGRLMVPFERVNVCTPMAEPGMEKKGKAA